MPVVVPTGAHGSDSAENCGGAAVAARRFDISVVVQRQIPMVLFRIIEIPVATAAVGPRALRRQIALALPPQCAAGVFALRCRVVVNISLLMVLTILHGTA